MESFPANTSTGTPSPIPAAAMEPSAPSGIICLRPLPVRNLPNIDQASALIADQTLAVPPEIVVGLLHAGTKGVLAAPTKVGKTWVLLDLATSVATGTPFLKWDTVPGKVLFVNLEIHRAFIKKRLEIIKERKNLPNLDNLNVLTLRGASADPEELLAAILDEIRGDHYVLIILDPIYKLMVGRSENMAGGVGALCQNIEQLVEKTGAAVVYAHHFTKGNQSKKTAIDRMSGSGVFARDADTIITLTDHDKKDCYAVEMTLRNFPPQPAFVVGWRFPLMVERPDLDPKDLKGEQAEEDDDLERLLALLDDKPLTTSQWQKAAEADGYSRPTFFRKKVKLEDGKRVKFDRKGKAWSRARTASAAEASPTPGGSEAAQRETGETTETRETTETPETGETPESPETAETKETVETNNAPPAATAAGTRPEVSSIKSLNTLRAPKT